ncbi:nucleotidyltransferase family protein [Bacillus sp. 2205SS5-2]|uniref:nucleotidyltransferase family protein n=1 Tax=Bacillus sp. 2205SS5-2 TaxID=3109031 RepID=UPI003007AE8F
MIGIILAGGEGRRLHPYTHSLPKPLVPIDGKPVMEYIVEQLKDAGIREIFVTTCYLGDKIKNHFQDGSKWGVTLKYLTETEPLGTAGHLFLKHDLFQDTVMVVSGDAFSTISLKNAIDFHHEKGGVMTIVAKQVHSPKQYGVCEVSYDERVVSFIEKPEHVAELSPQINTGIYIIEPEIFRKYPTNGKLDFAKDVFPMLIENKEAIYAYRTQEYWRDIGTVSQYELAVKEVKEKRYSPFRPSMAIEESQGRFITRIVAMCPANKKKEVFNSIISETPIESLEFENGIKVNHSKECWTHIKEYSSSSIIIYSQANHHHLAKEFAKYYMKKIQIWQKV